MNLVGHLKGLAITTFFVIIITLVFDSFNLDLDFLIGWWACMVWTGVMKYNKLGD